MYLAEKKHENIYYYKDVIANPAELIKMIEDTENEPEIWPVIPQWQRWLSNSRDDHSFGQKKDFVWMEMDRLAEGSPEREKAEYIVNTVKKGIADVAYAFVKDRGLDIEPNISPFAGIMKYRKGCEMGAHFDAQSGDQSLWWSIVLYLNDDYEGGEISFQIDDVDLRLPENGEHKPHSDINDPENKDLIDWFDKPVPGSALIFPSTFPYKHQVHVMKSGDKYMFPGFIFQPEFNPLDRDSIKKYNAGISAETADERDVDLR